MRVAAGTATSGLLPEEEVGYMQPNFVIAGYATPCGVVTWKDFEQTTKLRQILLERSAVELLQETEFRKLQTRIPVVMISARMVGFPEGGYRRRLISRVTKDGLNLCSKEVAASFLLNLQPRFEGGIRLQLSQESGSSNIAASLRVRSNGKGIIIASAEIAQLDDFIPPSVALGFRA
jgi:hypothetical protein